MKNFAIVGHDGRILRIGSCDEDDLPLQASEGEILLLGKYGLTDVVDLSTGEVVGSHRPIDAAAQPTSFVAIRRAAYPPVGEQLDMLWHAMDRGEIPKATEWFERIAAVKAAHPKAVTDGGVEDLP